MKKYFCDRCGTESLNDIPRLEIRYFRGHLLPFEVIEMEVCSGCFEHLKRVLKQRGLFE